MIRVSAAVSRRPMPVSVSIVSDPAGVSVMDRVCVCRRCRRRPCWKWISWFCVSFNKNNENKESVLCKEGKTRTTGNRFGVIVFLFFIIPFGFSSVFLGFLIRCHFSTFNWRFSNFSYHNSSCFTFFPQEQKLLCWQNVFGCLFIYWFVYKNFVFALYILSTLGYRLIYSCIYE